MLINNRKQGGYLLAIALMDFRKNIDFCDGVERYFKTFLIIKKYQILKTNIDLTMLKRQLTIAYPIALQETLVMSSFTFFYKTFAFLFFAHFPLFFFNRWFSDIPKIIFKYFS